MSTSYRCDICDARVSNRGTDICEDAEYRGHKVRVRISIENVDGNGREICSNCLPPIIVKALAQEST